MGQSFDEILAAYDYSFPQELIANAPASPRESARLLVYNKKNDSVKIDTFVNITTYLPENCVLVFNKTKVIPARFHLKKETGGIIETLFLEEKDGMISVLASGTFKKGSMLLWEENYRFEVMKRNDKESLLKPLFEIKSFMQLLEKYGETPLPPYIKSSPLSEKEKRSEYQTVFAETKGSVAAPTAGLHFSEELIKKIVQSGRDIGYVTLHVGLGTFAPLTKEQWQKKELHREYYELDKATAEFLTKAKREGRPIIAVGTTTVRTLESAFANGKFQSGNNSTNLFLTEESKLQAVNGLITNFHVPKSSLLMLVSSFIGRKKLLKLYEAAIKRKMRLFSFGDGMLII